MLVVLNSEYYPFGLQTANSWTRDNAVTNNFLFDAGNELNSTSGFYDLPFRNYDASLGRFFQVDPLSHRSHTMTPYHYAGNNPIGFSDPTGLYSREWLQAVGGSDQGSGGSGGGSDGTPVNERAANAWSNSFDTDGENNPDADMEKFKKGEMTAEEYVQKWGVGTGGGATGVVAALAYLAGGEQAISTVLVQIGQGLYGGQAFYNNGVLSNLFVSQSKLSSNGGYEKVGDVMEVDLSSTQVDILRTAGSSADGPGLLERFWNSDFMRLMVPDVLTVDVSIASSAIKGSRQTYALNLITRGKDAGFYKTTTIQRGYGGEWGAGINVGNYFYNGSVENLSFKGLLGSSRSATAFFIGGINLNGSYADYGDSWNNPSFMGISAGLGVIVGGGIGDGETRAGWGPFRPDTSH